MKYFILFSSLLLSLNCFADTVICHYSDHNTYYAGTVQIEGGNNEAPYFQLTLKKEEGSRVFYLPWAVCEVHLDDDK